MERYDYLIVGAGLFGSVCAHELAMRGYRCLVIDKRYHIGGNCYTSEQFDINVHMYGAHIFRTNDIEIWDYIGQFAKFNRFTNCPVAVYKNELYNLPFNMNTFNKMWGVITPEQARAKIEEQRLKIDEPKNLEEYVLSLVGPDIFYKLIKGYTEKQWGKKCKDLPKEVMRNIPLRFTYDNNYFREKYQGVPIGGYTQIFDKLLNHDYIEVKLLCDFFEHREMYEGMANKIIFTGLIDKYYDYCFGELEYRSLEFEHNFYPYVDNYQGNAVVNYTEYEVPYTRKIEHKHFEFGKQKGTFVTEEYPAKYDKWNEPFYPINNERNNKLYEKYLERSKEDKNVVFGGWAGSYQDRNMDETIKNALKLVKKELEENNYEEILSSVCPL